jgi:glycosyltransferase involved in cell wall biosynthesis
MKISVLICTRNRAKSLEMTLRRFYEQRFAGDYNYELIVVDNNSTDETSEIIERCVALRPETTRHLFERRRGLTYARNTGVAAASGEIIVFTDDDVLVSGDWLDEIHREFSADPGLCILSGKVLLANERLQRVALHAYEERRYFDFPDSGGFVMGANMAFRRELFDRVGLFDVRLGAGRFFAGADEVELIYRGLKAGWRMLYAPNVLVYHDHDRFTLEQACRLEYGYAKGSAAYLIKHSLGGDGYAMRMIYWTILTFPKRWKRRQGEDEGAFIRRRWWIKGMLVGLFAAPFVMWRDRNSI